MKDVEKEIIETLSKDPDAIGLEELQSEQYSPLNKAVKEKEKDTGKATKNWNLWKPTHQTNPIENPKDQRVSDTIDQRQDNMQENFQSNISELPLDAPEQPIGNDPQENESADDDIDDSSQETFELPTATAKQAADTILGMTNNVLGVGSGYFVKIRKNKEFYQYSEIVELIDQQNQKNIQRVKLDKEDKTMLKPLIVAMLKKKAKKLTVEQQLMGAVFSILVKKTQTVLELRGENEILYDRIVDIVSEEKKRSEQKTKPQSADQDILHTDYSEINENTESQQEGESEEYDSFSMQAPLIDPLTVSSKEEMEETTDSPAKQ
ncbi:hypothetical protein HN014_10645 [Aquimarina sp. TRL1]|uniref:hypothetical protein n=1 Tax=Aquimarina sp. (strain TRL1) TaxID=2736252 RepID=UPI00158B2D48|nr:hypothetical protein [Aquimarina sp. TRL1]QKX05354.1 hypothetical protein HN014_10645 [Aquimarina sp. TRL1]